MKLTQSFRRNFAMAVVIVPMAIVFIYVGLRSGPLAPIAVTLTQVESRVLTPQLFGIGTVEPRYRYRIGPVMAGRVESLFVDVGDRVAAGQILGSMQGVDLQERVAALQQNLKMVEATESEAQSRYDYAQTQLPRYERLLKERSVSEEVVDALRQESRVAIAAMASANAAVARARAELEAVQAQLENLQLLAPVNGIVVSRDAEPGSTVVAGQPVLQLVDPDSLWVNVRFDQISASGLRDKLKATIRLRSRQDDALGGTVFRVELQADAVTEELLAKIVFDEIPEPLPALGELAEVVVDLPALAAAPAIPNAAIREIDDDIGVFVVDDAELRFVPVTRGAADLEGWVQILAGLDAGEQVVLYSQKELIPASRIDVVEQLPEVAP